jgi:hypothetical protein
LQIVPDRCFVPSRQQVAHSIGDCPADLEYQPAAGPEYGVRLRDKAFDDFQAGWSGEDGISGLELADFELH